MSEPDLEQQVFDFLNRIDGHYQAMQDSLASVARGDLSEAEVATYLANMTRDRECIADLQRRAKPLFDRYRETHEHASGRVVQLSQQAAARLQAMALQITQLEEQKKRQIRDLLPEANANLKGLQMKSAYQQIMNT